MPQHPFEALRVPRNDIHRQHHHRTPGSPGHRHPAGLGPAQVNPAPQPLLDRDSFRPSHDSRVHHPGASPPPALRSRLPGQPASEQQRGADPPDRDQQVAPVIARPRRRLPPSSRALGGGHGLLQLGFRREGHRHLKNETRLRSVGRPRLGRVAEAIDRDRGQNDQTSQGGQPEQVSVCRRRSMNGLGGEPGQPEQGGALEHQIDQQGEVGCGIHGVKTSRWSIWISPCG